MKQYYVVDADNEDFDLDAETPYSTRNEAVIAKKRYEETYGGHYEIWEVD